MFNIAICDDCFADRKRLFDETTEYFRNADIECEIELYETGKALIEAATKKEYEILLLDIVLEDMNGISLAEHLRMISKRAGIVFISDSREFALDGYSVNAFAYLLKPLDREQFHIVLDKFIAHNVDMTSAVSVKCEGISVSVPTDKIVFVESNDKRLTFHLTDGSEVETKAKLDEYAVKMSGYENFLRCHKSYLVNMDYITGVKGYAFTLNNGRSVPIPKEGAAIRKKAYYDYIMNK